MSEHLSGLCLEGARGSLGRFQWGQVCCVEGVERV